MASSRRKGIAACGHAGIVLPLFLLCVQGYCQVKDASAMVGCVFPEHVFNNVHHFNGSEIKTTMNVRQFQGKWVILDFWTRSCGPCIRTFPILNELQKQFSEQVQVILVGINDMYNWQTESYFEGVRTAQMLELPVAYDSVLWRKLDFFTVPTAVVINPGGIIHDIVPTGEIDAGRLQSMMNRDAGLISLVCDK